MPWWLRSNAGLVGVLVLIGTVYLVGATVSDRFLTPGNLLNVYEQTTDLALVSIGQTLTVLSGGIDLSVGSLISLTSCLTSGLINGNPDRVIPVVVGVLALGTCVGMLNAGLVVTLRVHPLIVTLGMGAILQGVTLLYALGPVGRVPRSFTVLAYGRISGIPIGATIGGRSWHPDRAAAAISAARAADLRARRRRQFRSPCRVAADTHSHARLRLLGFLLRGDRALSRRAVRRRTTLYRRQLHARPRSRPVVLGGTLLSGGKGGVVGTLFGAFLIALLNNLLNFMDVSKHYQLVAQAVIIILAVSVYVERRRME